VGTGGATTASGNTYHEEHLGRLLEVLAALHLLALHRAGRLFARDGLADDPAEGLVELAVVLGEHPLVRREAREHVHLPEEERDVDLEAVPVLAPHQVHPVVERQTLRQPFDNR